MASRDGWVFPDTLVGTDSHTPMINGLGVLGWGVARQGGQAGREKAMAIKGVHQVVNLGDVVAVVADHMWAAKQGLAALAIRWDDGPNGKVSTADVVKELEEASRKQASRARNEGARSPGWASRGGRSKPSTRPPSLRMPPWSR